MIKLNEDNVVSLYAKIKRLAKIKYLKGNIEGALNNISTAAHVVYLFNFIYKDDVLEQLLSKIAFNILPNSLPGFQPKKDRYVLIDSLGWPRQGLTQQYLRGLISMNVDFLYISENLSESKRKVYDEVKRSEKGSLFLVSDGSNIEKIKSVYDAIIDFKPSNILAHIFPWDVVATTVLYSLPSVVKYNINLTDHAFWLGAGCFNYTFEFREYGCTVSMEKRGFSSSQVLLNPYYPIVDEADFLGFPEETENKTILFSGGSYYKIYGEDGIFFRMMKQILDENPNTVILFAGTGDDKKTVENYIAMHKLGQRFLLLGYRSDIDQVFAHCDIYLSTYPFAGGLMTQYAAYNAKPVVAYSKANSVNNRIEDFIFCKSSQIVKLTYTSLEDYYAEIRKLVKDKFYRISQGNLLKNAIITKNEFDISLSEYLNREKYSDFNMIEINYNEIFSLYLDINNTSLSDLGIVLFKHFKVLAFFYLPRVSLKCSPVLFKFGSRRLLNFFRS